MIKLKLSDGAVFVLREELELFLGDKPESYLDLLEHGVIAGLLKRKLQMFYSPKAVNSVTLSLSEAAVLYRVIRDSRHLPNSVSREIIDVIGRKLPENMYISINTVDRLKLASLAKKVASLANFFV